MLLTVKNNILIAEASEYLLVEGFILSQHRDFINRGVRPHTPLHSKLMYINTSTLPPTPFPLLIKLGTQVFELRQCLYCANFIS